MASWSQSRVVVTEKSPRGSRLPSTAVRCSVMQGLLSNLKRGERSNKRLSPSVLKLSPSSMCLIGKNAVQVYER